MMVSGDLQVFQRGFGGFMENLIGCQGIFRRFQKYQGNYTRGSKSFKKPSRAFRKFHESFHGVSGDF